MNAGNSSNRRISSSLEEKCLNTFSDDTEDEKENNKKADTDDEKEDDKEDDKEDQKEDQKEDDKEDDKGDDKAGCLNTFSDDTEVSHRSQLE